MQRRDALRWAGAAGATLLTGCLSRGAPPDYGSGGATATPSPTPGGDGGSGSTDGPGDGGGSTPSPTPGVVETSFSTQVDHDVESGNATVSFGDDVVAEGTIMGNNGCYRAELSGATVDDGTLTVRVRSYEDREEDEACTMAIVHISYRATVTVAAAEPNRVVVVHERNDETTTVADVRR